MPAHPMAHRSNGLAIRGDFRFLTPFGMTTGGVRDDDRGAGGRSGEGLKLRLTKTERLHSYPDERLHSYVD